MMKTRFPGVASALLLALSFAACDDAGYERHGTNFVDVSPYGMHFYADQTVDSSVSFLRRLLASMAPLSTRRSYTINVFIVNYFLAFYFRRLLKALTTQIECSRIYCQGGAFSHYITPDTIERAHDAQTGHRLFVQKLCTRMRVHIPTNSYTISCIVRLVNKPVYR